MTLTLEWPHSTSKHALSPRQLRRPILILRLWRRRLAHRRFIRRVLAETHDPRVLADLRIRPGRPSDLERWIMAMLWHQH
jgi:hypothetical protein